MSLTGSNADFFAYSSLDGLIATRVLTLLPGQYEEEIHCVLENVPYNELSTLGYEALSYAWGSASDTTIITCQGRKLVVTKSVSQALYRLRQHTQVRKLWIDQICINQKDSAERSEQVQHMKEIYQRANRTVIWLGEEVDGDAEAFSFLQELVQNLRRWNQVTDRKHITRQEGDIELGEISWTLPGFSHPIWSALGKALDREWFFRLWVVQEVMLCKEAVVQCGHINLHWSVFLGLAKEVNDQVRIGIIIEMSIRQGRIERYVEARKTNNSESAYDPAHCSPIDFLMSLHRLGVQESHSLLNLIVSLSGRQVTDPRDRIYGYLGLTKRDDEVTRSLQPDYNLSWEELYIIFATRMVKASNNPWIVLRYADCDRGSPKSWVPNWNNLYGLGKDLRIRDASDACRGLPPLWHIDKNKDLIVRGRILDTVRSGSVALPYTFVEYLCLLTSSHVEKIDFEAFITFIKGLIRITESCNAYSTENDRYQALARTLHGKKEPLSAADILQDLLVQFSVACKQDDRLEIVVLSFQVRSCLNWSRVMDQLIGATSSGFIINTTPQSEEGDVIVLIYGCPVPFVLRQQQGKFLVVGSCYIHGLMDGEAIDQDTGTEQDFVLT